MVNEEVYLRLRKMQQECFHGSLLFFDALGAACLDMRRKGENMMELAERLGYCNLRMVRLFIVFHCTFSSKEIAKIAEASKDFSLGWVHVQAVLVEYISKKDKIAWLLKAVANRWDSKEFAEKLRLEYGRKNPNITGRPVDKAIDGSAVLRQLRKEFDSFNKRLMVSWMPCLSENTITVQQKKELTKLLNGYGKQIELALETLRKKRAKRTALSI